MELILGLFVGAVGTFLATGAVELLKINSKERGLKRNFKLYLKLELTAVTKILAKIKDHSSDQYINYRQISSLDKHISELEAARRDSVYLDSQEVQEKYFDYLSDLSTYANNLRSLQALKDEKDKEYDEKEKSGENITSQREVILKFYEDQKQLLAIDNVELQRKSEDLMRIVRGKQD